MSFNIAGKVFSSNGFEDYLKTIKAPTWATAVCLHHTAAPSLLQRPKGLLANHIENLKDYYQNKLGWSSGPHLFIDEDQCWGMTPLTEKGVHAVSFNSRSIGIEVLGDFDTEDPKTGRGIQCWQTAAEATKDLLAWLKLPVNDKTVLFHRDDPKTSKTCPGTKVKKDWFLSLINGDKRAPVVETQLDLPVVNYVTQHKGYSYDEAVNLLKKRGTLFFFGDDWLEGAHYSSAAGATVAPLNELKAIVGKR